MPSPGPVGGLTQRTVRWLAISLWAYAAWILLTWTRTAEELIFGAVLAAAVGLVLAPLGPVAPPWALLRPRTVVQLIRIVVFVAYGIVRANVSLTRRIWSPSRPLRAGMVVVPTEMTTDGELTAVGLFTSAVVDNQVIDVDRERGQLQYHAVWVDSEDPEVNRRSINGGLERLIEGMRR